MSRLENCIMRREAGIAPNKMECMECLKELTCPVYKEYKAAQQNKIKNYRKENLVAV